MLKLKLIVSAAMALLLFGLASAGNFSQDTKMSWGDGRGQISEGGQLLSLSLDNYSGSGFESVNQFLYGRFDVQMKLVPNNSAGTVTTFFLSSLGESHDEIDLEFLGNSTGQPYTLHTNIYSQGSGNREQQFRLWFNPTTAFHTYTILWNSYRIIIMVDNIPIRVFNNNAASGVPFPSSKPMKIYASLWNADDWATQGGTVKTDWTQAPFIAYYRNFNADGCIVGISGNSCTNPGGVNNQAWQNQGLDAAGRNRLRWVQQKHMIYNYCTDLKRFNNILPTECKLPRF